MIIKLLFCDLLSAAPSQKVSAAVAAAAQQRGNFSAQLFPPIYISREGRERERGAASVDF
jgi:hypothetical protein